HMNIIPPRLLPVIGFLQEIDKVVGNKCDFVWIVVEDYDLSVTTAGSRVGIEHETKGRRATTERPPTAVHPSTRPYPFVALIVIISEIDIQLGVERLIVCRVSWYA